MTTAQLPAAGFDALGTTIRVVVTEGPALSLATEVVRARVAALDLAASRFRPDSELMGLGEAGGEPVTVSATLFAAVEEALGAAERTGGLLDPTVGEALVRCGYDRDFGLVAPDGPPLRARYRRVPGWRAVRLDPGARTVAVPRGVRLDLGATAKAGCADRSAAEAAALTGAGVLVNLGGDLAVAGPPPEGGWPVRVADRVDAPPGAPSVTVAIVEGGLATSGTAARRWTRGGQSLHHVIDPVTGGPATPCWRTVTVAAPSCLEANVSSTAAVVLGPAAPRWLAARGHHARLVGEDGTVRVVGGWPAAALGVGTPTPGAVAS